MKRFKEWLLINDKKFTIDEVLGSVGGYPVQHNLSQGLQNQPPSNDYGWSSQFGSSYGDEYKKHFPDKDIDSDDVGSRYGSSGWGHNFKDGDKKIIENPRNFKLIMSGLEKKLEKLGIVNIHFYFGYPKDDIKSGFTIRKELTKDNYDQLKNYFYGRDGMNISKSDIVYMKTSTAADPLTPWLILHTFAHGIFDRGSLARTADYGNTYMNKIQEDCVRAENLVKELLKDFLVSPMYPQFYQGWINVLKDGNKEALYTDEEIQKIIGNITIDFLTILFPSIWSIKEAFKIISGARSGQFIKSKMDLEQALNSGELQMEIFVFWLTQGGRLPIVDPNYKVKLQKLFAGREPENFDSLLEGLESRFNEIAASYRSIIDGCRGEVIMDRRGS
jgi:hypothetical protein